MTFRNNSVMKNHASMLWSNSSGRMDSSVDIAAMAIIARQRDMGNGDVVPARNQSPPQLTRYSTN